MAIGRIAKDVLLVNLSLRHAPLADHISVTDTCKRDMEMAGTGRPSPEIVEIGNQLSKLA